MRLDVLPWKIFLVGQIILEQPHRWNSVWNYSSMYLFYDIYRRVSSQLFICSYKHFLSSPEKSQLHDTTLGTTKPVLCLAQGFSLSSAPRRRASGLALGLSGCTEIQALSLDWCSDMNNLTPIYESPQPPVFIATVCKTRHVIFIQVSVQSSSYCQSWDWSSVSLLQLNRFMKFWSIATCKHIQSFEELWLSCIFRNQCSQAYGQQSYYSPISILPLPWEVWNFLLSLRTCELCSKIWLEVTVMAQILEIPFIWIPEWGWLGVESAHPNPHQSSIDKRHECETNLYCFIPLRIFRIASYHSVN